MKIEVDVIIVGAGLVGLALACLLIKNGRKVAVVEKNSLNKIALQSDVPQLRVSAINLQSMDMLKTINVWSDVIASNRAAVFEKMFVWDSLGRGQIHFDCTEIGKPHLGYIIENAVLHNALLDQLNDHDQAWLLADHHPLSLALGSKEIALQCQTANGVAVISGELLVGADGAKSWVREKTNIDCYGWSYHHQALVTTVKTEKPHQRTAWQCFLPDGPLALLPLADQQTCSIVWSSAPLAIERLRALDKEKFNAEITQAFEHRLGSITQVANEMTLPLAMQHAKTYIKERIALIGDAAHTIHPLAGLGANLGFLDAAILAAHIHAAKETKNDCGHYMSLRRYERDRKSDNWITIAGMEGFKRLFESDATANIKLRSLGLNLVNNISFIKNLFVKRATG